MMITIPEIQKQIDELVSFMENHYKPKSPFTKEKGRIAFLRHIIMFSETNPSEDYVKREAKRLDKLIISLEGQFETWAKNTPPTGVQPKKYKAVFNKEMGLTLLRLQRKTAFFILNA